MSEIPTENVAPVDPVAQAQAQQAAPVDPVAQAQAQQAAAQAAATAAAQKAAFDQAVAAAVSQQLEAMGAVSPDTGGAIDPGSYGEGIGQESDKTHAQRIEERIAALEAKVFNNNTEGSQA